MLEQIIDDFYPVLVEQEKNIHLNQDEDITLYGDADKLSRVFSNVIKNPDPVDSFNFDCCGERFVDTFVPLCRNKSRTKTAF